MLINRLAQSSSAAAPPAADAVDSDRVVSAWFKSGRSNPSQNCVEVAWTARPGAAVRDSKYANGPRLVVGGDTWRTFKAAARNGGFTVA